MSVNRLKKKVLEVLYLFGQMSKQEMEYLFLENYSWIVKIAKEFESRKLFKRRLEKCFKLLIKEGNIREYLCDSGYRRRYGIPELPLSNKIQLKLKQYPKIEKCGECHFPIVIYKNKFKHLLPYFCDIRKNSDNVDLRVMNSSNIKFIFFKSSFLGVLDKNKIRLPFKDHKDHKPEFFIALEIYRKKYKKKKLTLRFQEVVV